MIDLMLLGISANREGPTEQRTACPNCNMGRKDTALGINMETGVYHCFRCGLKGRAGLETGVLHTSAAALTRTSPGLLGKSRPVELQDSARH